MKSRFLRMLVFAVPAVLLAGCPMSFIPWVIEVYVPFDGQELVAFEESVQRYQEFNNVDILVVSPDDLGSAVQDRIDDDNLPAVLMTPSPGWAYGLYQDGHAIPVSDWLTADDIGNFIPAWVDMVRDEGSDPNSTDDDTVIGLPYRATVKSLVWYSVPELGVQGTDFTAPATWTELLTLTQNLAGVQDGPAPWSIGIESGFATGWPATDWLEEFVLKQAGPSAYDNWTDGSLAFDSTEVNAAFDEMEKIFTGDGYVYQAGVTEGIAGSSFVDAAAEIVDLTAGNPNAVLYKQGSFALSFFPDGTTVAPDGDVYFFPFPTVDGTVGNPMLAAGDFIVPLQDNPAVRDFVQWLATPDAIEHWVGQGTVIPGNLDVPQDWFPDQVSWDLTDIARTVTEVRFDASDMMPYEIGSGAFWTEMTDWVNGPQDAAAQTATLQAIDDAWAALNQ